MSTIAIKRITAAALVLEAHAAGEFTKISARDAFRLGYDIEGDEAWHYDWPDGTAIGNSATGQIEVAIPNVDDLDCFVVNPATGEISLP